MNITELLLPSTTRNHPTIGANHFTNTASSSRLFRDYCFGKEYKVADRLVSIIDDQHLDGIDLDYEYCYDIKGKQAGQCAQRSALYSDAKAQTFLNSMTSMLRTKLDALQVNNGYNRGRYEVTHAPMDSDLAPSTSAYFQILKERRADLDFIMPQVRSKTLLSISHCLLF